ncbi:MAG: hypothetical protein ABI613_04680 [Gemmatimonadota bacterium]
MADTKEHDAMICRSCGNEERASEGYPCSSCGTFICLICTFRGVVLCNACQALAPQAGVKGPLSSSGSSE